MWEDFARLVLEVSYEATICAAILNGQQTGHKRVYLTLLGGGVFGNWTEWILTSIKRALVRFKTRDIHVRIVSFGDSNYHVRQLIEQLGLIHR